MEGGPTLDLFKYVLVTGDLVVNTNGPSLSVVRVAVTVITIAYRLADLDASIQQGWEIKERVGCLKG